jgi:hypothetical protein
VYRFAVRIAHKNGVSLSAQFGPNLIQVLGKPVCDVGCHDIVGKDLAALVVNQIEMISWHLISLTCLTLVKRVERNVRNCTLLVIDTDAHPFIGEVRDRIEHLSGDAAAKRRQVGTSIHTSVHGDSKVVRSVKL